MKTKLIKLLMLIIKRNYLKLDLTKKEKRKIIKFENK
jgi:hypothetical protein